MDTKAIVYELQKIAKNILSGIVPSSDEVGCLQNMLSSRQGAFLTAGKYLGVGLQWRLYFQNEDEDVAIGAWERFVGPDALGIDTVVTELSYVPPVPQTMIHFRIGDANDINAPPLEIEDIVDIKYPDFGKPKDTALLDTNYAAYIDAVKKTIYNVVKDIEINNLLENEKPHRKYQPPQRGRQWL